MNDKNLSILGQVGGYSAGLIAWLEHFDNLIGLIGTCCAAGLSVWALVDKFKKRNKQ